MWEEYLLFYHKNDIFNIIQDTNVNKWFSININFLELFDRSTHLGSKVLNDFEKALAEFDVSVVNVQKTLQPEGVLKRNIQLRIFGLPSCTELNRVKFPTNKDLGKLLQISGTVIRMTDLKLLEYKRNYVCKKCKQVVTAKADYEQYYVITPPKFCTNKECGCRQFMTDDLKTNSCQDYQEIKVQEQINRLGVSSMPTSMWITLENDLVDTCKPGDNIIVCGIIKQRWKKLSPKKKWDIQLVMKANHIHINNEWSFSITPGLKDFCVQFWEDHTKTPLIGRDFILKSLCPELYGLYVVKLAVALILAGGSCTSSKSNSGVHTRAEPHLLLVGDPGIGKSQLLCCASKINPRSVLTTGVGSTSAGLTVAAFMEDGEWHLEAGALVLSDGGICCIDEFNSMKEHDRTSIHEAMEQQSISVAKAGIVSKLNTRCSILAATNPSFNLESSTSLNLNIASPLLSRFDLVLIMKDKIDDEWDESVADYILNGHKKESTENDVNLWSLEMLQVYFATIKKLNPVLSLKANEILSNYYQIKRRASTRNKARTTVRLLDSLVRLSQAHARLMFRSVVEVMDAVFVVSLVESSMSPENSILNLNDHSQFPDDPTNLYTDLIKSVLNNLNLNYILEEELEKIQNMNITDYGNVLNEKGEVSEPMIATEVQIDETVICKFKESDEMAPILSVEERIEQKLEATAPRIERNQFEERNNLNDKLNNDIQEFLERNSRKRKKSDSKDIDVKVKDSNVNRNKNRNQDMSNDQLLNLIPSATDECDMMQHILNRFNERGNKNVETNENHITQSIKKLPKNKEKSSSSKFMFEENNCDDFDFDI